MSGDGWDDVGWSPPDDVPEDFIPPKRRRRDVGQIAHWSDTVPDQMGGHMITPAEAMVDTPVGRSLLRNAQLTVTDRNDNVEQARWELAMLGLIPDPYPAPDSSRDPLTKRHRYKKKKEEPSG